MTFPLNISFFLCLSPPVKVPHFGKHQQVTERNRTCTPAVSVIFTLTDRTSTIPSNVRGCQPSTWSLRSTKVNASLHGDSPLLKPKGIKNKLLARSYHPRTSGTYPRQDDVFRTNNSLDCLVACHYFRKRVTRCERRLSDAFCPVDPTTQDYRK